MPKAGPTRVQRDIFLIEKITKTRIYSFYRLIFENNRGLQKSLESVTRSARKRFLRTENISGEAKQRTSSFEKKCNGIL